MEFPLRSAGDGRMATADADDHVREMVEQVLFTAPGERVNRPDFGCGLLRLPFEPNGPGLAAATEMHVRGALQRWLSDVIDVNDVRVVAADSTLSIGLEYTRLADGLQVTDTFTATGGGAP
ncbi:MAG TPA: GPW/gp25 family protein [Candidatus Dormibacteraeota bacterium]|nr:GPW/gp25 family protein [Candidatus Dormibacteraeota bacterium]